VPRRYYSKPRRSRARRQHWVKTIQRLNSALFINAKYSGLLRTVEPEADDIGGFPLEIQIIARQVAL
jgi:hypothetical protein